MSPTRAARLSLHGRSWPKQRIIVRMPLLHNISGPYGSNSCVTTLWQNDGGGGRQGSQFVSAATLLESPDWAAVSKE
jgi:hypothetical protein